VRVIESLLSVLPQELRRHNRLYSDSVQIQLRVAVDVGPVVTDKMGMSGEAIILASRLQDAPNLKQAIGKSRASLGVIVSNFVYDTAIRHGGGSIDPGSYSPVRVNVKETRTAAWMQLIDPTRPGVRP
jgi:class 3 adenylate cyclase